MPGAHNVVYNGKEDAAPDCHNALVHCLYYWVYYTWPEAEKDDNANIDDRIPVNHGTNDTEVVEGSLDKL